MTNQLFLIICGALIILYTVLFLLNPTKSILAAIVIKPIIDMSYASVFGGTGINLSRVAATLFALNMIIVLIQNVRGLRQIRGRSFIYVWFAIALIAFDWRQLEILFGDNYFSRFSP